MKCLYDTNTIKPDSPSAASGCDSKTLRRLFTIMRKLQKTDLFLTIPILKKILILLLVLIPLEAHAFERYNRVIKYDMYFSKYSKRYFGPDFDWLYFKAQAVAESSLYADAKSKAGAVGVMQIMPRTFKEISKKNPSIKGTRKQPRWNIAAGIYYNRTLWKAWSADRPFQDRINFMFASYNAGRGNILKAQRIAKKQGLNLKQWQSIEQMLSKITGKQSKETIGYIRKIKEIKGVLK